MILAVIALRENNMLKGLVRLLLSHSYFHTPTVEDKFFEACAERTKAQGFQSVYTFGSRPTKYIARG
jgi:hypothetical protein